MNVPMRKGTDTEPTAAIKLTVADYRGELHAMSDKGDLPVELAVCLIRLMDWRLYSSGYNPASGNYPEADPALVLLAKEYLMGGIVLKDADNMEYDVAVYVPRLDRSKGQRKFFKLIPKHPEGDFKLLKDL